MLCSWLLYTIKTNFNIIFTIVLYLLIQLIKQSLYPLKMGQDQSTSMQNSARQYTTRRYEKVRHQQKIQHQGVLKLRSTPFSNCIQIDSEGFVLFLEHAQTTLSELLQGRLYTNRLFPYEDIQKLIQSIVYALAFFENVNVPYRHLCPQNIYYCKGDFKLLPNELIEESAYEIAYHNYTIKQTTNSHKLEQFISLSPQMIIAMRHGQSQIDDEQILNKSNVFILGIILLEVCTMLPSSECFDHSTYDIFNNIITERLEMVEDHYDTKIARIIANMIDYDYSQRMLMKDIAIWINREFCVQNKNLAEQYESSGSSKSKVKTSGVQSEIIESQEHPEPEQMHELVTSKVVTRTNNVYMKKYNDLNENREEPECLHKGPKNKVYLNYQQQYCQPQQSKPEKQPMNSPKEQHYSMQQIKRREQPNKNRNQILQTRQRPIQNRYRNTHQQNNNVPQFQKRKVYDYSKNQQRFQHSQQYCQKKKFGEDLQNRTYLQQIDNIKPKPRNFQNPYMNHSQLGGGLENKQYYPSVSQLEDYEPSSDTRRINLHSEVGIAKKQGMQNSNKYSAKETYESKQSDIDNSRGSINDGSINRIKLQIEKSRKLIQQFRKSEGIPKF